MKYCLLIEVNIQENGIIICFMDTVLKYGKMGLNMKVIGNLINDMVKDNFGMLMETSMKVN